MFNFFLTLHFIIAIFLTLVIIIQKKEADGGGAIGFGGGASGGAFTPRGEANILTRATYTLAAIFIGNCLLIGKLVDRSEPRALDSLAANVAKHANVGIETEKKSAAGASAESRAEGNGAENPVAPASSTGNNAR